MTNGEGSEGAKKETPEDRLVRLQAGAEQNRKAREDRLAGVEQRAADLERLRAAQETAKAPAGQPAAQAEPAMGGAGPEPDRLAAVEAKLRERQEREERIRRMERVTALEKRMAAQPPVEGGAPSPIPRQVTYVRARGARVGSMFFYVLLAAGVVLLLPDLLKDLAGVNLLGGFASNNSTGGWFFRPIPQLGDAVTGLGLVGIVLVVTAIAILGAMLVVYRKR